jgi:hypothetical protein
MQGGIFAAKVQFVGDKINYFYIIFFLQVFGHIGIGIK